MLEFLKLLPLVLSLCSAVPAEPTDPLDYAKFLTQYSSVIMRNLEQHINVTEGYLIDNNGFTKKASTTLDGISKSLDILSKNVGLGNVPVQDLRQDLNKMVVQVSHITAEQMRQKEEARLLVMKVDLVLQTLLSHKEDFDKLEVQQQKIVKKLDVLEHGQNDVKKSFGEIKASAGKTSVSQDDDINQLTQHLDVFTTKLQSEHASVQSNIKHIKDITDENFMILRNQLKEKMECSKVQPKIYHS